MARQSKAQRILTHSQVWTALDRLAERAGMSPSGLAKRSGLDPTTFNKSKRITADGRERWPSTESVSKALAATNSSIDSFVQLIGDGARGLQSVPLLALAQAGWLDPNAGKLGTYLSGALFIVAGGFQFTTLKHACLRQCRNPFPFFFSNWTTTTRGVFRLGVKQGMFCLGF